MTELNDAANDAVAEASVGYAALEQFEALEEYEEDLESLKAAFEPIEAEIEPIEAEIVTLIPNASPPPAERPEVLRQQDEVVERFAAPSRKRGQRRPAATEGRRAAFTLRLDAERHLQLRLACTLTGKSAQQLVTDALDKLISELPDVSALAVKVSEGRQ
jgi:predicted HicB family RNase H-like nuclease